MRQAQALGTYAALLLIIFGLCSCDLGGNGSDGSCPSCDGSDGVDGSDPALDQEILDMAAAGDLAAPPVDGLDKLQAAESEGTVTRAEAVGHKIGIWFDLANVPVEYSGETRSFGRSTMRSDRQWVYDNLASLSAAERTLLEPFILPPVDSNSLFSPEYTAASRSGGSWANIPFEPGTGTEAALIYYYEEAGMAEQEVKAEWVRDALVAAWPKFNQLLNLVPTDLIDIYLGNTGSDDGVATWKDDYCEICINKNLDEKGIKTTTAHELFHCFQYYVPMLSTDEHEWLSEVTAVWSEHHVYPSYNSEWGYHDYFFPELRNKRIRYDGKHEYGNYLFALFAEQYLESVDVIGRMVLDAKTKAVPQLVYDNIEDFPEAYRQFSLYCFNQLRWKLFTDDPSFPAVGPSPEALAVYKLEEDPYPADASYTDLLPAGGISYDLFTFGAGLGDIGKAEFDFSLSPEDEKIRRTGIFIIGDQWVEEDWSDRMSRQFCRNDEDERVKAVMLIIANSDLEASKEIAYGVKVEGDCGRGNGYVRWTERLAWPGLKESSTSYYQEDWLAYDETEDVFVSERCHKSYLYNEVTTVEGIGTVIFTGSGSLNYSYPQSERPARLNISVDRTEGTLCIDTDDGDPDDWVTYIDQYPSGIGTDTYTGAPTWAVGTTSLYTIDLGPEDFSDSGIKGTRTYYFDTLTVEIEFQYDGL